VGIKSRCLFFSSFPCLRRGRLSVGIGIEAVLADHNLSFIMNIESRMTPVQYFLDKVLIDQLLAEKKREGFKYKKLTKQGLLLILTLPIYTKKRKG